MRCFVVVLILVVAACQGITAQPSDTILPNPKAQPLRRIWEVHGGEFGGGQVGGYFLALGDVYNIGTSAWAVSSVEGLEENETSYCKIYVADSSGTLSTDSIQMLEARVPVVSGDFLGTGRPITGCAGPDPAWGGSGVYLYRSDSFRLEDTAWLVLNPRRMIPYVSTGDGWIFTIRAADLDKDGDDELIFFAGGAIRNGVVSRHPEVWIYRGGADFQVDTPTVVLRDSEPNSGGPHIGLTIGRLDEDEYPDLMTQMNYYDGLAIWKAKIFFGSAGSPWNWSQPDRVMDSVSLVPLDCTGDSVLDVSLAGRGDSVWLFRSDVGKSIRTRSLDRNDVDDFYHLRGFFEPRSFGFLSDSGRVYEMLAINAGLSNIGFSGSPGGPDHLWDTYSNANLSNIRPIPDVTGDGWDDLMTGYAYINFNSGFAAIYAGGPYIPRDPASGVEYVSTADNAQAIAVWPNPATTDIHIAWRGDLKQMPRAFRIHTMDGRLVASGSVESWRGEVVWHCSGVPAGSYMVSVFDYTGELLGTTRVIRK